MNIKAIAKPNRQFVKSAYQVFFGVFAALSPTQAIAHDFGLGKGAYEDFLSGIQAVLADLPVLVGIIAAGVLASIWKSDGLPSIWLSYFIGILVGAVVGFSGFLPPIVPTYATVIVLGLLGAAAPKISVNVMRGLYVLIGIVLCNAVLSGHSVLEIPLFAYFGMAFAFNVGIAVWAGLVSVSLDKLPYGWVLISWRAGMSWLVAITVIAMTLLFSSPT